MAASLTNSISLESQCQAVTVDTSSPWRQGPDWEAGRRYDNQKEKKKRIMMTKTNKQKYLQSDRERKRERNIWFYIWFYICTDVIRYICTDVNDISINIQGLILEC